MKTTPSGSYENESLALKTSAESTVAIPEENKIAVMIYPNPAQDFIQIDLAESMIGSNFQLIDASGKIIISGNIFAVKFTLDITKLAAGHYSLISTEGQFDAIHFVKN
jgi:hypothetical protein